MSVVEFIGFIISFAAFIFLMFKRVFDEWQAKSEPVDPAVAAAKKAKMQEFLKSLDIDMQEAPLPKPKKKAPAVKVVKQPPPIARLAADYKALNTSIVDRYSGTSVVSKYYENLASSTPYVVTGKSTPSRAHQLILALKSKKDMVLLNEIISRPKSLRR